MANEKAKASKTVEQSRAEVNILSKEALKLEQELNYAEGAARRAEIEFEKNSKEEQRKNALHWYGKAWRAANALATIKEKIRCNATMLAEVEWAIYKDVKNDIEKSYLHKSNGEYYAGMSERVTKEREETLARKQNCMQSIKSLRSTTPAKTTEVTA